jgi:hypothetical protein
VAARATPRLTCGGASIPHVVIEGALDLEAWARDFEPILIHRDGDVLRADRVYLETGARTALVEMLAIEAGRKQPFYARVALHDRGSFTVRVDPLTHPERSEGVRALVACLAAELLRRSPSGRVTRSNVDLPRD